MSNAFEFRGGVICGPSPYEYFIGDPRRGSSYGCMAPVIAGAMKSAAGNRFEVKELSGESLSTLYSAYVEKGNPVLIWVTMGMVETFPGTAWYLPDGSLYYWPSCEHCMVLMGSEDDRYLLLDPETGGVVSYQKDLVEMRYDSLGKQAVVMNKIP